MVVGNMVTYGNGMFHIKPLEALLLQALIGHVTVTAMPSSMWSTVYPWVTA